jgi:uncharacterized membrane protein
MIQMDKISQVVKFIVFALTLFWALATIVTPYMLPSDSVNFGDDGVVGEHEHEQETTNMSSPFARWVYGSGDGACHQRASRSFFLNGNQMPYCSRCTAIFTGLAIGMFIPLFVLITDIKWWLMAIGFVPLGIDGTVQLLTSYESNNALRLMTGLLTGVVTSILIGFIIEEYVKLYREHQQKKVAKATDQAPTREAKPESSTPPQVPEGGSTQVGTLDDDIQPPIEQNTMLKK